MSLIADLWSVLDARQRRRVLAAQLLSLAMAASTVVSVAAIAPFFAVLGDEHAVESSRVLAWVHAHGGFSSRSQMIHGLGAAFALAVVGANLLNAHGFATLNRLAFGLGAELRVRLFGEYLARPYLFHVREPSSALFGRIVYETARLGTGILQSGFLLITQLAAASLIVLSILVLDPAAAAAMLLALGGGYASIYWLVRRRVLRAGETHSRAWSEQARIVSEALAAAREIALLEDRSGLCEELARASRSVSETAAHVLTVGQVPKHIVESIAACALVAAIAGSGELSPAWLGRVTLLSFAAYRLLPALQQIFTSIVRIRADRTGFALIAADLKEARMKESTARAPAAGPTARARALRGGVEIRLKDVSFRYADDLPWVVHGVSIRVPRGAMLGLVGANGCGKTTLMDLIAGLLAPSRGTVEIDGIALDEARRAAWRTRVAYVPQSIVLLDRTLEENIALGVRPAAIDRRRVEAAARLAQLEELVTALPEGYRQRVGERGIRLSGGQRQRIGIARALYRDSPVLLLDEPAAALDGLTELELASTLERLRGRQTIIVISHRLPMLRACETLHRLDGARLAAGACRARTESETS